MDIASSPAVPIAGPSITDLELEYVQDAARLGWYEDANLYLERFERAFADYVGTQFAIAVPHCTAAIHLGLEAAGIGPGDEVIVPELTWIATAGPICQVGATPVFADVDPITWCLSAKSLASNIGPKTKAVIGVDLYGGMPMWHEIRDIARSANLLLIEDAAQAIGSFYHGKPAGSLADFGVFSFHGSKTMTTGEGGMLVTNDRVIYELAARLRDHGRNPGEQSFVADELGFKYRMSGMQAALGLAQLERIDELVETKRRIFRWYYDRLGEVSGIDWSTESANVFHSHWMSTATFKRRVVDRDALAVHLGNAGISTRPMFPPLSSQPAMKEFVEGRQYRQRNTAAYYVSSRGINLPSALRLTKKDVDIVCDRIDEAIQS